jgi:hypothetical protein
LTERFSFNSAARFTRNKDIGSSALVDNGTRDRVNAQAALTYLITPELSFSGGYRFAYLDLPYTTSAAHSNAVFISVGYHGQPPPRN